MLRLRLMQVQALLAGGGPLPASSNTRARIPLCGLVSQYNDTRLPDGPDRTGWLVGQFLRKCITVQGFIVVSDFGPRYPEFAAANARLDR